MKKKTLFIFIGIFALVFVSALYTFNRFDLLHLDQTYFTAGTSGHGKDLPTSGGVMMTEYMGGECEDPGYVYCGDDVCGVDEAWCDNWNDGGGHCKESDPDWCCYDSGYVVCGDTDTCGPSNDWCENFLNGDKSCNYVVGGDRCCNDPGWIYDYGWNQCCSPTSPYTPDGKWCYTTPREGADNFYTRHSKCSTPNVEVCSSQNMKKCEATQSFIYDWKNYGYVKGKCGVECVANTDCVAPVVSNVTFCSGKSIYQNTSSTMCTSLHACSPIYNKVNLGTCSISCMDRPNGGECSDSIVYKSLAAAVIVIIALAIGAYFYFRKRKKS